MNWILALLLTAAIILSTQDGAWFPWVNFGGACLFVVAYLLTNYMRYRRNYRANKLFSKGLMGGLTPPDRKWFTLTGTGKEN